jgi:nitrite reductase/ring-hydroxylating ferredoxin subunit
MTLPPGVTRRCALAAGLAGAGTLGLAACGGGSSPSPAPSTKQAGSQAIAKVADVPVGQAIGAKLDGADVIVARPEAGSVVCFSATCTHQGCTVQVEGTKAVCPCHNSVFNALTGAVLQTPAPSPLHKIAVLVKNGEIVSA